jgi:hypothetical protein
MLRLKSKTALVTGGTSGFGLKGRMSPAGVLES